MSGFLEHPLTRGLALDDPRTTEARLQVEQDLHKALRGQVAHLRAEVAK